MSVRELLTKKMTRRSLFRLGGAGVAAVAGGYGYARFGEAGWFEVTRKEVKTGRLGEAVRILHLSDLHASPEVSYAQIERAVDLGLEEKPDLICLTGDYITGELEGGDEYVRVLKKLSAVAPTYACLGNHDCGPYWDANYRVPVFREVTELLEASGVRVLENEREGIELAGQRLEMVGLGDLWWSRCQPKAVLPEERKGEGAVIVLTHNPDSKKLIRRRDWDLALCGHTHGGQLKIPLLGWRPILPVEDKRFAEGLKAYGPGLIHVTRGVGNLHGMRINCRPEVSLLDFS